MIELVDGNIQLSGNETYGCADIANNSDTADMCKLITDNVYEITASLMIGYIDDAEDEDGNAEITRFVSKNEVIMFRGDTNTDDDSGLIEVMIGSGCVMRTGDIHYDGSTENGSVILGSGISSFGGAGDLYAYSSKINMWCEWKFANSVYQKTELIDCMIDGYGTISGISSKLRNVVTAKSSGLYGSLLPIGRMKKAENVRFGLTERSNYEAAVRFDRSSDIDVVGSPMSVYSGCVFSGYKNLVSTDGGEKKLIFVDCEFNATDSEAVDTIVVDDSDEPVDVNVEFRYSFEPKLVDINGVAIAGAKVKITNELTGGELVLISGTDGAINSEITYAVYDSEIEAMKYINEFKLECITDKVKMTRRLVMNGPIVNSVLYMTDDRLAEDRYDLEWVVDRLSKIEPAVDRLEDGVMQTIANTASNSNFVIVEKNGVEIVV